MAGAEFIGDNKGKEEMEIEITDDGKTGDYEQQQNCQEALDEEDEEEAEELSTSGIKATSYQIYTFSTWFSLGNPVSNF